jgi:hypothetical protein
MTKGQIWTPRILKTIRGANSHTVPGSKKQAIWPVFYVQDILIDDEIDYELDYEDYEA